MFCSQAPSNIALTAWLAAAVMNAAAADEEIVPENTAIVEVICAPRADISIDGRNYGTQRTFRFQPLPQGRFQSTKLRATFADGTHKERQVHLIGGQRILVRMQQQSAELPEAVVQHNPGTRIMFLRFTPDGNYVLSGSGCGDVLVWDTQSGLLVRHIRQNTMGCFTWDWFDFPTVDDAVLTRDANGLSLRSLSTGGVVRELADVNVHTWPVLMADRRRALALVSEHPDPEKFVPDIPRSLIMLDAVTGRRIRSFPETATAQTFAISRDESTIAAMSQDGSIFLLETATGRRRHVVKYEDDPEQNEILALSSNGQRVAVITTRSELTHDPRRNVYMHEPVGIDIREWDVASGRELPKSRAFSDRKHDLRFAGYSATDALYVGTYTEITQQHLLVRDPRDPRRLTSVAARAISDDGTLYLTLTDNDTAEVRTVDAHRVVARFRSFPHPTPDRPTFLAAFSPDNQSLIVLSHNRMQSWNVATGRAATTFDGYRESTFTSSASVSADCTTVATGAGSDAHIWDLQTLRVKRHLTSAGAEAFQEYDQVRFSQDGSSLLTTGEYGPLRLWNLDDESGDPQVFDGTGPIIGGRTMFDLAGTRLVSIRAEKRDAEGEVTRHSDGALWNPLTGTLMKTLSDRIRVVSLSGDGSKLLLRGSRDDFTTQFASVTDTRSDRTTPLSIPADTRLAAMAAGCLSKDGRLAVVTCEQTGDENDSQQPMIGLFEAATGRLRQFLKGPEFTVNTVAFSPQARMIAAGCDDGTVWIWNTSDGRLLQSFDATQRGHILSLTFTPNARYLLAPGWIDDPMRLLDVATGETLANIYLPPGRSEGIVVTPEGLFDGSPEGRRAIAYRIGDGLGVVSVDRFFNDFYSPGLLTDLLNGKRPVPSADLGTSRPPIVRIISPEQGGDVAEQSIRIEVEVEDGGSGISGPWLRHNGARVASTEESVQDGDVLSQTFAVTLVEGDNRIRVEAASGDGSWESEPAQLQFYHSRSLAKPDLYILTVGINDYTEQTMNLQYATADAQSISRVFEQRGDVLYDNVHTKALLNDQATKRNIRKALREIAESARPQDTLLAFLSGHGFTIGQRYYFIPHEFENDSPKFADDVRDFGYPGDELADAIGAVPALKRLLILDTCNSGAAIGRGGGRGKNPFAFRGAIERLSRAQGIFTIAASAASEDTVEIPELGHGVLTYSLLAGLRAVNAGPLSEQSVRAINDTQVVGALEWFSFADQHVPELTSKYLGTAQDVKMSGEGTSFPVLPLMKK